MQCYASEHYNLKFKILVKLYETTFSIEILQYLKLFNKVCELKMHNFVFVVV